MRGRYSFLSKCCLVFLSLLLIWLTSEVILGVFRHSPIVLDDKLGWKPGVNYLFSGKQVNEDGSSYQTVVSQDERGFRHFGHLETDKPKLMVIGDSFTQALQVSDERTYYAVIGQQLNMEVFAYGIGGAGTLQESLAFDQYFEEISPDIILWQYCSNDFVNNTYNLEFNSRINNNGMTRPYLEGEAIVYRIPKSYPQIFTFFIRHSRVVRLILTQIYQIQAKNPNTVEAEITKLGAVHPGFHESYQVTWKIMEKVKRRAGGVPIVAFNCDNLQPYQAAFRKISEDLNIYYIEAVGAVINQAQQNGQVVLASDGGHWNETGHALAGQTISRYLKERSLSQK